MKRFKYLFSMIVASVLLFAGCAKEETTGSFANIQLNKTYLSIPEEGGSVELKITATEAWSIDTTYTQDVWPNVITRKKNDAGESYVSKCEASWLTVDKMEGSNGETVLHLSAEAVSGGRELELCIKAGMNSQFFKVRQGSLEASSATCAEIIAGQDGKTYRVQGTVTGIANTTYGNWYLNDGTGEVYVYGTLDKDGKEKNFTSLGIEIGDVVEVEGPKLTYGTTVELVNVTVLSIKKSLLKIITPEPAFESEGGELEVKVAFKGEGLYPVVAEDAKSWISISGVTTKAGTPTKIEPNPADTALVKILVAENVEANPRTGVVSFTSSKAKDATVMDYTISQKGLAIPTIAEVIAAGAATQAETEGVIVAKYMRGALISDGTGYILVYKNAEIEQVVGDKIKVSGPTSVYGGMLQFGAASTITLVSSNNPVVHPTPTVLDAAGMDAQLKKTSVEYIEYVGTLSVSGNYYNVTVAGTTTAIGSLQYINKAEHPLAVNGAQIKVRGYFIGVSSSKYVNTMTVAVLDPSAAAPETPSVMTLTNAEICAAMTSSSTSYTDYTIQSASGVWSVNASQNSANTFLQCRGKKGAYIKTPEFDKDIRSVTIHFTDKKSVYANNTYCVFPTTWTPPTADAAYPEDGNVGKAVTDGSYSLTIPVNAGNKQVYITIIGTYAYYLDHIDVAF